MKTNLKPSADTVLDFIERASDEEILAMYRECGLDVGAIAEDVRRGLLAAQPSALPRSFWRRAVILRAWKPAFVLATLVLAVMAVRFAVGFFGPVPPPVAVKPAIPAADSESRDAAPSLAVVKPRQVKSIADQFPSLIKPLGLTGIQFALAFSTETAVVLGDSLSAIGYGASEKSECFTRLVVAAVSVLKQSSDDRLEADAILKSEHPTDEFIALNFLSGDREMVLSDCAPVFAPQLSDCGGYGGPPFSFSVARGPQRGTVLPGYTNTPPSAQTTGAYWSPGASYFDVFIIQTEVPEPASTVLYGTGVLAGTIFLILACRRIRPR